MGRHSPLLGSDSRFTPERAASCREVRKKASQRLGVLGSLLNRRSGFSIRNGVLLYKQRIRQMMDYACPIWRCEARTYVKQLQALQSKCLRIATGAPSNQPPAKEQTKDGDMRVALVDVPLSE
jgi:hypothetical protein